MAEKEGGQDNRYYPTEVETKILVDNIGLYHSFPKRSKERTKVLDDTLKELAKHSDHWNAKNLRVWFTNNQEAYVPKDQVNQEFFRQNPDKPSKRKKKDPQPEPPQVIYEQIPTGTPPDPYYSRDGSGSSGPVCPPLENLPVHPRNVPMVNICPTAPHITPAFIFTTDNSVTELARPPMQGSVRFLDSGIPSIDEVRQTTDSGRKMFAIPPNVVAPNVAAPTESYGHPVDSVMIPRREPSDYMRDFNSFSSFSFGFGGSTFLFSGLPSRDQSGRPSRTTSSCTLKPPTKEPAIVVTEGPIEVNPNQAKTILYDKEDKLYRRIRSLQKDDDLDEAMRQAQQREIEKDWINLMEEFRNIGIENVYAYDATVENIGSMTRNKLRRTVSRFTKTICEGSGSDSQGPVAEEVSKGIYAAKVGSIATLPNDMKAMYRGKLVEENGHVLKTLMNVECSHVCNRGIIFVRYDGKNCHRLSMNGMKAQTGFITAATSIAVDEEEHRIWIAGDYRVKAYDMDTLENVDTLYVGDRLVNARSCLAIWGDYVVMAYEKTVVFWKKSDPSASLTEKLPTKGPAKVMSIDDLVLRTGVDRSSIDFTQGRKPEHMSLEIELPGNITSMCAVGEYLAIGSEEYPVIHTYKYSRTENKLPVAERCIGHTGGISSLVMYNDTCMLSGSLDGVPRIWNIENGSVSLFFKKHEDTVTALYMSPYSEKEQLWFTGGNDKIVNVSDVKRRRCMFQICLEDCYPKSITFNPTSRVLTIVASPGNANDASTRSYDMDSRNEYYVYEYTFAAE